MIAAEELGQGDEVVVGLAHLLAVNRDHVVVHPVVDHLCALTRNRLRNLAFVMWEDEVHASAVDVEVLTQVLAAHSRAFAVPSGESIAPRRRPAHDVFGLCGFPQSEVRLVLLLADSGQVAARVLDVLEVSARKDAPAMVLVILLDVEVDAAVALVGIAVVEDLLHQGLLLDDVSCGMRLDAWRQAAQRVHRLVEAIRVVLRHFHGLELFQASLLGNLVLSLIRIMLQMTNVRDVSHITHLVADMLEITEKQVERDGRPSVSEVRITIDSRAADIHADSSRIERFEEFLLPAQGIINE